VRWEHALRWVFPLEQLPSSAGSAVRWQGPSAGACRGGRLAFPAFGGPSQYASPWELETHRGSNGCENACVLVECTEIAVVFMASLRSGDSSLWAVNAPDLPAAARFVSLSSTPLGFLSSHFSGFSRSKFLATILFSLHLA